MPEVLNQLQQIIDDYTRTDRKIRILEAGCGSMSKVKLRNSANVVGIDISSEQLERNTGLCEKILGDVQTYQLPERAFDMIICWDVLEHLDDPASALKNFFRSCRNDGIIVLAFPNLYSLKGLATKLTPHKVHIWYYKYILHVPDAGAHDTPPFITHIRIASTYPSIRKLAKAHNAEVIFFAFRESNDVKYMRKQFWFLNLLFDFASAVTRLFSIGKFDAMNGDCIMVLRVNSDA